MSEHTWPADGTATASSQRIEESCVETHAYNYAHLPPHGIEQVDDGITAVGDGNDLTIGHGFSRVAPCDEIGVSLPPCWIH
jgi:hypothetical protein